MVAGADWTLQNEDGWDALQEAVFSRQESIAMIIVRHYQPLAWAKWCRRLPRLIATMRKMKDFYMEMSFHFETPPSSPDDSTNSTSSSWFSRARSNKEGSSSKSHALQDPFAIPEGYLGECWVG